MQTKHHYIGLPFYIFITLLLGGLGVAVCVSLGQAGNVARAWILAALFIAHIGLYWLNIRPQHHKAWWGLYYTAQTILIVTLVVVAYQAQTIEVTLLGSTILCLIGEALGLWGNSRTALLLGVFYFGLGLALIALLFDRASSLLVVANLVINGGFIVLLMVVFNQQLIERQRATDLAESLESANAKLAAYAARIETLTLQAERQRMARELHDTLAQGVAGLVLQLEALKVHLAANRTARAGAIVEQALSGARRTLAESRAAIDDLRSTPANLAAALRETLDRFTQATGIACAAEFAGEAHAVAHDTAGSTLHILSEALANVARHAQATQVAVAYRACADRIELEVRDNGSGFDPRQEVGVGHYGLLGMRERARLVGGTLAIESRAPGGTCVHFTAPSGGAQ